MVGHVTQPSAALLAELPSWLTLVRAPNPGPMTLEGTNTWVLRAPGTEEVVVIDPGPLDEGHLASITEQGRITTLIATHAHSDHVDGMDRLLELCPTAEVWGLGHGQRGFTTSTGVQVNLLETPGHTADSISLLVMVDGERAVFTGDTILGRGTTVVAYPDGDLGDYLRSLRHLERLGALPVLPGHGPALADCAAAARFYLDHRLRRLEQVREAWAGGAGTVPDVVAAVYADVDRSLWSAAELSVRAQVAYLRARESSEDRESNGTAARLDPP